MVGAVVASDAMMSSSGSDGQPETLAGVTVTLTGDHAMGEQQETNMETGGYAFTGLRAGSYTVTISGYPDDVEFEELSMTVEVGVGEVGTADFEGAFIRTAAIEGRVIIEGEGLPGVTVTLVGGPADESHTKMTGADGEYAFTELRPGTYQVDISGYDPRDYEFAATSQEVSVGLDETETVSFTGELLRTAGIAGRVSVEGMGLGEIEVTLSGAADASTTTDASGQYAFAGLAAGDYTVSIAVESDAYVFDAMSADVTVADDQSAIVNFEGAHATTASVSGMLFLDEATKNDAYDEGEDPFPAPGVPVALVGPGVNDQRVAATGPDGSFMFSNLVAGAYQLVVLIDPQVQMALGDFAYGGPAAGYSINLGVGEAATQAIPFDITHQTVGFSVSLRHGDGMGAALPGAMVSLYADMAGETKVGSGETGEDGVASIRIARAGTSGNMVYAGVMAEGYHVADGTTPVAWDPKVPATVGANANDIVNLNAEVAVTGKTVETGRGGGYALAGWALNVMMAGEDGEMAAVEGAAEALNDEGMAPFESAVAFDDLPMSYYFAVAEEQNDSLDGGEMIQSDTVPFMHDGLSLAGAMDVALTASFATQTLKVYVHHERDQVEGFTGGVLGGDRRMSGSVEVEVRYTSGGISRAFANSEWDAGKNTDEEDGVWTFSHVPAGRDVVVAATVAADTKVVILDPDQLATYEDFDDNGVTGGAFGDEGGFHHTVELCPLKKSAPTGQDFNQCASFGFVKTYSVDGQVWKNGVERDDDDGFDLHLFADEDPVAVEDIAVNMVAVEGKNLAGEDQSHNSTDEDGEATIPFDFKDIADGVYALGVSEGWMATAGMGGDALPEEFLLEHAVNDDGHLNIDVTPATGVLYGRITDDATDQPAEGVTVDVNGESDVTDEFGRYIVEGFDKVKPPKDPIIVTLSGAGFVENKDTIDTFTANEPVEHNLSITSLGEVAMVSGAVSKSNGDPVAGVTIKVNGKAPLNATGKPKALKTGADGSYSAQVNAGSVTVTPSAPKLAVSFIPASHTFTIVVGQEFDGIDFTAYDHATITGRVLDPDGAPVEHVEVSATPAGAAADADPAASYTTRSTGAFTLSVPFGAYTITADEQDGSYSFVYPNDQTDGHAVNVAPGQRLAIGDIAATLSASGLPPRFTSSASFSVAQGKRTIGTVTAVDDDSNDEVTGYTVSGGDDADKIGITSAGVLQWAPGDLPKFDDETAANNKYKVTVTATSGPKATATGTTTTKTAEQKITVTLTPSGDAVVTLAVTPDSISEGQSSVVSATLESAASSPFTVTVSVTEAEENGRALRVSPNKTLFFAAGDTANSGASVTISSINDNDYTGTQTLTVTGRTSAANMTVKSDELKITDNDVGPGRVVLMLVEDASETILESKTSIDEGGTDETVLIARVVGGTTYSEEITVTVAIGDGATGTDGTSLTISTGARQSTEAITVTSADDDDDKNEVVVITGTATLPDGSPVSSANQPGDVILAVEDDDENPSSPRNLAVTVEGTAADPPTISTTATWDAPANLGVADGTDRTEVTYQYRFERSSVIGDAGWEAAGVGTQALDLTGITGVDATNVWDRDFTVQIRVTGFEDTVVTKEFRTPANPGTGS